MKKQITCGDCNTENIIIESKLFFSEKVSETEILCASCMTHIETNYTDGWFLVQTKQQFEFEEKIEEQKRNLCCAQNSINTSANSGLKNVNARDLSENGKGF